MAIPDSEGSSIQSEAQEAQQINSSAGSVSCAFILCKMLCPSRESSWLKPT